MLRELKLRDVIINNDRNTKKSLKTKRYGTVLVESLPITTENETAQIIRNCKTIKAVDMTRNFSTIICYHQFVYEHHASISNYTKAPNYL